MPRNKTEDVDMRSVRGAVKGLVETGRLDAWLLELPDPILVQAAAPPEMLTFQYYLTPSRDRHLVRAARVVWEGLEEHLDGCPDDMATALSRLGDVVGVHRG